MRFLTFDVGGTEGKGAVYDSLTATEPLGRFTFPVTQHTDEQAGNFFTDYAALLNACDTLAWFLEPGSSFEAVGLAIAGKVNDDRTQAIMAGNLAHWVNHPVGGMLGEYLACEVVLGNDAEAAALAEFRYGLGRTVYQGRNLLSMIWGTGVGGAVTDIAGDRLRATNIEPGHVVIQPDSTFRCRGCQEHGHLEAYCGGANLPKHFGKTGKEMGDTEFLEVVPWMADGLEQILQAHPVDAVSFSGGIACKRDWLLPVLERELGRRLGANAPEIQLSAFGEEAGTLGGLALLSS